MSSSNPLKRRTQETDILTDAQSTITKAKELNQKAALGTSFASTDRPKDAAPGTIPQPVRLQIDPVFIRKREETLRATGEALNQRCVEKMERLNKLKQEHASRQPRLPKIVGTIQDQQLAILRLEEARLQAEYKRIQANREVFPEVLPEVTELRVLQTIQDSIRDYGIMLPRLKRELEDTRAELASEKQLLKELKEINQALQARRRDLANLTEAGMSQESSQTRKSILERRAHVQDLTKELTRFLNKHYPPVQPDPDDLTVFLLKDVLEDIMNMSVSQPADPYVDLVPGQYFPPHIERLINAGIAVRHPRDSQKLRLIDFYS
ncbi:hypothetical protein BGZ65_001162 [Modicella reniformis]|uniref:Uncharacterized protein n=1 Tax=Modicella reniformis TaxID=1440133 RepID=A0A9P6MLA9_9FUNG|nr:hypothetical protein BGZ65_001162 [Modicella reniformis]